MISIYCQVEYQHRSLSSSGFGGLQPDSSRYESGKYTLRQFALAVYTATVSPYVHISQLAPIMNMHALTYICERANLNPTDELEGFSVQLNLSLEVE